MGVSISEFRGEYYFLSNFYSAPVTYNGMCFENNEAAFQAAKCPERMTEFSHRYACWANNHNGWAKAKKSNKRLAKRRLKDELRKELVYSASDKQVGE